MKFFKGRAVRAGTALQSSAFTRCLVAGALAAVVWLAVLWAIG